MKKITICAATLALLAGCGADPAPQPWILESECSWRQGDDALRASIAPGDGALVMSLADPIFRIWPQDQTPRFTLVFDDDPARAQTLEGWVSHGNGESAILGFNLNAETRQMLGSAHRLAVKQDDRVLLTLPLAATPSADALEQCVPSGSGADSE
ncbi:MAG: hypothetical protein LBV44_07865 [Methylobacillus sp.]|jgi:hypothetical protein|nr:hypothetical protein [Methylobacillus sp.]